MASVGTPVSVGIPFGDQNSTALSDGMQLLVQAMLRLQNDMRQQMAEALHTQLQEALCKQEQRMQEAMLQQEEKIREITRQQALETEERLNQREEALNQREKRIEKVLKEMENKEPTTIDFDERSRKRKRIESSLGDSGSRDNALGFLEGRVAKMEEAMGRALESMFPRVEVLIAHIEATTCPQAPLSSDYSPASAIDSPSTSVSGSSSTPVTIQAISSASGTGNAPPPPGNTAGQDTLSRALMVAARGGRLNRVRRLLNAGADVNYSSDRGKTSLICASTHGHASVVSLLLQRGANVHATGPAGLTVLHFAAVHDRSGRCLQLIMDAGAHVDSRLSEGSTPLHMAAMKDNHVAVRMLLEAGASKTILNDSGQTPFDIAISDGTRTLLH